MKVVPSAEALGLFFSNDCPGQLALSAVDWDARLHHVAACYSRLACLPLTVFGRTIAAAGYGVSRLLYHAEFSSPPATVMARLESMTAKLVDRDGPSASPLRRGHRLPGIPSALMVGRPSLGGVGMLPWRQHIAASHAMWGIRLIRLLVQPSTPQHPLMPPPPWVLAASAILMARRPTTHPAFAFLAECSPSASFSYLPSEPLCRLARGLAALGPPVGCDPYLLPTGPWCSQVPLWAHPLLRLELAPPARPPAFVGGQHTHQGPQPQPPPASTGHWALEGLPGLTTLGDLAALIRRLNAAPHLRVPGRPSRYWTGRDSPAAFLHAVQPGLDSVHQLPLEAQNLLSSPSAFHLAVEALWQDVPRPLRAALRAAGEAHAAPSQRVTAVGLALRGLAWPFPARLAPRLRGHRAPSPPPSPVPLARSWPAWVPPDQAGLGVVLRLFTVSTKDHPQPVFSVKQATQLQLGPWHDRVSAARASCVEAALSLGAATDTGVAPVDAHVLRLVLRPDARRGLLHAGIVPYVAPLAPEDVRVACARLGPMLRFAWNLLWENSHKETWWRLLLGGVPGAGGHGVGLRGPCPCGWAAPGYLSTGEVAAANRAHVFWECAPARAVRALLQHNLPPGSVALQPRHLWLLDPPGGSGVHEGVWAVVCLAALSSLDRARSFLWARALAAGVPVRAVPVSRPLQRTLPDL